MQVSYACSNSCVRGLKSPSPSTCHGNVLLFETGGYRDDHAGTQRSFALGQIPFPGILRRPRYRQCVCRSLACFHEYYITVSTSLFTHVKMKALVQSTRFFAFDIIDSLIKSHLVDVKAMGEQFVAAYASLASGEKDPRNLLVAFAIARVVLTEFDISKHVDVGSERDEIILWLNSFDAGLL